MKRYALVDAAIHVDAAASYRQRTGGIECCALLPPGVTSGPSERGAWLMRLDGPKGAHAWLRSLQARDARGITVLASARTFDVVLIHLQLQLRLRNAAGPAGLLRFHDPRVMAHVHHFISVQQMEELFAPFTEWRTCDRDYLNIHAVA